jgi:putative tryptophan/tyrosine transport system substrate-binding protein
MNRRHTILALVALGAARAVLAQQSVKIARIGFLHAASAQGADVQVRAFRDGLRELGYLEGKNLAIEYRWGEGKLETLPALADDCSLESGLCRHARPV